MKEDKREENKMKEDKGEEMGNLVLLPISLIVVIVTVIIVYPIMWRNSDLYSYSINEELVNEATYYKGTSRSKNHSGKIVYQLSEDTGIKTDTYVKSFDKLAETIKNSNDNIDVSWNLNNEDKASNLNLSVTANEELSDEEILNILKTVQITQSNNSIFKDFNIELRLDNPLHNQYDEFGNQFYNKYKFYSIDKMNFENMDSNSLNKFKLD